MWGGSDQLTARQYFDLPYMKRSAEEIFVDGGVYDGITSVRFMKWCEGHYSKIYLFEPDEVNAEKSRETMYANHCKAFEIIKCGLWNEDREIGFHAEGSASSTLDESMDEKVKVCCMDDAISEPVTFIKYDIEGAEYNGLLGARRIIETYKPKLAICIYHRPEDIWELPKLILQFRSDYKFYLRHYSLVDWETVLYAI
jgi:FkbM family methyltransferase